MFHQSLRRAVAFCPRSLALEFLLIFGTCPFKGTSLRLKRQSIVPPLPSIPLEHDAARAAHEIFEAGNWSTAGVPLPPDVSHLAETLASGHFPKIFGSSPSPSAIVDPESAIAAAAAGTAVAASWVKPPCGSSSTSSPANPSNSAPVASSSAPATAPSPDPVPALPAILPPETPSFLPRRGPPKPDACPAAPRPVTKEHLQMALPPFKPAGALGKPLKLPDGGYAWRLDDGSWSLQYEKMAARVNERTASTQIAWPEQEYAVEVNPSGISYHSGTDAIHRSVDGNLVFHYPTGTIHQDGDTTIYHWCDPNLIVYNTPAGLVYYDDAGITYRGRSGLAHWARSGEVLYQGVDGITRQTNGGSITQWTESGLVNRHHDGHLTYTLVGESQPRLLEPLGEALGPDPFPGSALTPAQVWKMLHGDTSVAPAPSPFPAMGPSPSPSAMGPSPSPSTPMPSPSAPMPSPSAPVPSTMAGPSLALALAPAPTAVSLVPAQHAALASAPSMITPPSPSMFARLPTMPASDFAPAPALAFTAVSAAEDYDSF
eukprot:TRINITY_DN3096_c0_g1_i1.p1 TRINITY_DN3096_c0_g1~~TRINITY_DN3096_c0_g1_i1.p1  ORF type:complete len:543 (+),score=69.93 TRINITY_DN3096_c0_g1_i1:218-1846(+)